MTQGNCIRINVGAQRYEDKEGNMWHADKAYVHGSLGCLSLPQTDILSTSDPISDTSDDELFQTIRMGEEIIYRFDLPNGDYEVGLLFAEIYWETGSAEQQDVYVQGKRLLRDFNIYDEAQHDRALRKKYKVMVTEGYLEVKFIGRSLPMHSGARACAIEIRAL